MHKKGDDVLLIVYRFSFNNLHTADIIIPCYYCLSKFSALFIIAIDIVRSTVAKYINKWLYHLYYTVV
jgi:hypothetical protein